MSPWAMIKGHRLLPTAKYESPNTRPIAPVLKTPTGPW
jgi:hypothetical protein